MGRIRSSRCNIFSAYLSRGHKTLVHNRMRLIACMTFIGICGFIKRSACTSQNAVKFMTRSISG